MFFHYLPTYFHLHIHFVHVKMTQSVNANAGRAILLSDVIDNIEHFSPDPELGNYYQVKTLSAEVKEGTKAFEVFKQNKML